MMAWAKRLFCELGKARTTGVAAEMAFWLFLSLLPLAAVMGLVAARFAVGRWDMAWSILSTLPSSARDLISNELGRVAAWNGGKVGIVSALVFVWLASSGLHAVFEGLELETEAKARPWWKKRLLAVATAIGLSVGVALLAFLGVGVTWISKWMGGALDLGALGVVQKIVRLVLGLAIATGLVAGLYRIALPPAVRKTMPTLPGAALAVALQTVLGVGYGFYIAHAGDGGAYQAGLAAIGVTMTALYLMCVSLLVGAEVNQMIGARRSETQPRPAAGERPETGPLVPGPA
jgi:membrane protein